jgi:TetR/AcrR family transcriptional repressor of bet genes
MASHGFERATIQSIAAEAQLSPGLVHYHYPSKQAVLLDLIQRMAAFREKSLDQVSRACPDDPNALLAAFLDSYLDLSSADPQALAAWTAMGSQALKDPAVHDAVSAILQASASRLQTIISQGVRSGAFSCVNIDATCAAILAIIQGYFFLAATNVKLIPKGSAAPTARAMAFGLLNAKPPPSKPEKTRSRKGGVINSTH